jgi:hypothetical protein
MHSRAVDPEREHVVSTVTKGVRVRGILASVAAGLVGVLLAAAPAAAAAVNINDASHVLDVTRVQNEAATLPDPVDIYTTTKFANDKAAFDRETQSKAAAATVIVIAINTQSHHLAIRTGTRSRVTQNAAQAATQAFTSAFRGSDYTAATIAALQSMRTAIGSAGAPGKATKAAHQSGIPNYLSNLLCLLLVGVVVALIVAAVRRSRGRARKAVGDSPGGYGPPGYGPSGYGAPPGSGASGVNPWVAGGVGAVAGGVLGYGLGHMGGEREDHRPEAHDGHANTDTGFGGGGADGDFGGGGGSGDTF